MARDGENFFMCFLAMGIRGEEIKENVEGDKFKYDKL
jgi:hypothetical protein